MQSDLINCHDPLKKHEFVIENKNNPTPQEVKFLNYINDFLRINKIAYYPSPQYAIKHQNGFYIIDLFFPALRIGFEVDGAVHWRSKQVDYDIKRKEYLEEYFGIKLYSIPNSLVDDPEKFMKFQSEHLLNIFDTAKRRLKIVKKQKKWLKKKREDDRFGQNAYQGLINKEFKKWVYILWSATNSPRIDRRT